MGLQEMQTSQLVPTIPSVPRRSPIQVLTWLNAIASYYHGILAAQAGVGVEENLRLGVIPFQFFIVFLTVLSGQSKFKNIAFVA